LGVETTASQIRLYELVFDDGRSSSPYVWRIRYALARKGLPFESVPLGFTQIPAVFKGRFKTVPVIEHGDRMMAESWDIAEYLDRAFPDRPPIFSGPAENAMVRLFDAWFVRDLFKKTFSVYALDIYNAARPDDRPYFRESRERWLKGTTLEAFTASRESRLPGVRDALAPLRSHLERNAFLGGNTPNYADFIALGAFHWVACMQTLPMLAKNDDVLRGWLDRSFAFYPEVTRGFNASTLFES
jgi:glutathione S-transferase